VPSWQIDVFFKWIKQNLKVKTLWGYTENAAKTHLWVAICTYLIVACLKQQIRSPHTLYEMTQILGLSIFSKIPVNELFTENESIKITNNPFICLPIVNYERDSTKTHSKL